MVRHGPGAARDKRESTRNHGRACGDSERPRTMRWKRRGRALTLIYKGVRVGWAVFCFEISGGASPTPSSPRACARGGASSSVPGMGVDQAKPGFQDSTKAKRAVDTCARHRGWRDTPKADRTVRILWKCWRDGVAYDEAKYLERLRLKASPRVPRIPSLQPT